MNLMIKSMLLLTAIGIPAVGAVSYHDAWSEAVDLVHQAAVGSTSVRAKDETRLTSVARAQTSHEPARAADAARIAQAFGPPPEFGGLPPPRGALAPIDPHIAMGPTPTRATCEDHIDFEIAMATYVKAKLRLQPSQRETWQKLETAAQGPIDKIRAACAGFPADANAPMSLPEMLDAVEADMSARAELLRATREPLRALFSSLTPEQRIAAQPPVPPPHRP
jgi:hypothetical protein